MQNHELEAILLEIRAVVLELRRLEGDGQLAGLKSRLAELVSHDPSLVAA
jgi:hypothetical protein